ncbi:symplekin [Aplysia californica]|uniref:Symplekin n=1 Tax=Aplysia californica TaxID=6500 RepID=A0ABM0K390_APLCA|nr:symplekin [Aplysia californica]
MASSSSTNPGTSMDDEVVEGTGKRPVLMKRSTAAQFFSKDDDAERPNEPPSSTYDIVVELLNNAAVMQKSVDKIANLKKVKELIVHNSPDLLDNFLDEMLAFQTDVSKDVKKFIIGFMEEACKKDNECLPKVLPSIVMLLADDDVNVQKKIILTANSMFKLTLSWITKAKKSRPEMTEVWNHLKELKTLLYEMLESVNDGIRTHVVKFLEGLTLVCSRRTADSEIPKKNEGDISLDQVSQTNGIAIPQKLEEDGRKAFNSLLQFQSSPHISSINLMTVMNALSNIAKQRPDFFDQVVQSYEALHVNLPPTLAKSQVSSVRKNLKTQMMGLLKHPASVDFLQQISTLLTDLGASQSEIAKNMPKDLESRKRKATQEPSASYASKKHKLELDEDDDGMTPWVDRSSKKAKPEPAQKQTAIDVTAEDILPRLNPQNVADLVLLSMVMLPDAMPAQFQSTYTPIAAAGTETQISHIARLLATQLTMAGMGKGLGELQLQAMKQDAKAVSATDDQPTSPKQTIQTVLGLKTEEQDEPVIKKPKMSQLPLPPSSRKMKQFQLSSVTRKLDPQISETLSSDAMKRIIEAERAASVGHVEQHRVKLLASLTSLSGESHKNALQEHIFNDIRGRQDLAFAWLYQEYANLHGYSTSESPVTTPTAVGRYDECLTRLLVGLMELDDHHGDILFHKLLLEAPAITDNAISVVKKYCAVAKCTEKGMKTLSQLINTRPAKRGKFLDLLLEFSGDEKVEVRNVAIETAQSLHASGKMQEEIETYATQQLKKLLQTKPPVVKSEAPVEAWTEDSIKAHLYLHLGLLPSNHKLIHELANIYTATSADIKRTILRVLEVPVRGMGMDSPELLTLVENCPRGSETLVMRVIHILTDKAVPSPELVERIRDLYHKRVPDVRFLIPVLNGLSKSEVMEALPKLIKLNPMVVKEVFNRLMGSHVSSDSVYHSPLTPVELLVALHNIDSTKCDMKTIIKAANLCFSERNIYTQEVLAIVMQQLMEQEPLPTLLMRTVIQSLSMYPRLIGFVLNILQRLIVKKVWKQKKVWEGFIRCCQRAKPQSFQVLLQLPATQLKEVFEVCPDLREPLLAHVESFTENQKSHINKAVMAVLEQGSETLTEVKDGEKNITASNGNDREEEPATQKSQKIDSVPNEPVQKISTVTAAKKTELASVKISDLDKTGGMKISVQSGEKDVESAKEVRSEESEASKERRRERGDSKERRRGDREGSREKNREKEKEGSTDKDSRDSSKKTTSKSSRKDDTDAEDSKTKSSSSSSRSTKTTSSSSSSSSRRSSSTTSRKK